VLVLAVVYCKKKKPMATLQPLPTGGGFSRVGIFQPTQVTWPMIFPSAAWEAAARVMAMGGFYEPCWWHAVEQWVHGCRVKDNVFVVVCMCMCGVKWGKICGEGLIELETFKALRTSRSCWRWCQWLWGIWERKDIRNHTERVEMTRGRSSGASRQRHVVYVHACMSADCCCLLGSFVHVHIWEAEAEMRGWECVHVWEGKIEGRHVQEGVMLRPGTGGDMHHRGRKYHPRWSWRQRRQRESGKMEWIKVECWSLSASANDDAPMLPSQSNKIHTNFKCKVSTIYINGHYIHAQDDIFLYCSSPSLLLTLLNLTLLTLLESLNTSLACLSCISHTSCTTYSQSLYMQWGSLGMV
jgi:hypothetical protein